jgi:hypothetical protein
MTGREKATRHAQPRHSFDEKENWAMNRTQQCFEMLSGPGETGHICALRSLARCAMARGPLYVGLGKVCGPAGALQLRVMAMHEVPKTASALRRSVAVFLCSLYKFRGMVGAGTTPPPILNF